MIDGIERTLHLTASPSKVWAALTDPAELAQWFPDAVDVPTVRPGSEGWLEWNAHGRFAIRFETVEPERRLVWTWARDKDVPLGGGLTTTVEFRLTPRADGGTTLVLRESGFATQKHHDENSEGWEKELGELLELLGETVAPGGGGGGGGGGGRKATGR